MVSYRRLNIKEMPFNLVDDEQGFPAHTYITLLGILALHNNTAKYTSWQNGKKNTLNK